MTSNQAVRRSLRILVVDDNVDLALGLAIQMRIQGHEVWTASDGEAAVEAARLHGPDLILMDLGMPRMSGLEAARAIRGELSNVTIIAVSGRSRDEDRAVSESAGIDLHVVKPISCEQLVRILDVVRRRRHEGAH